MGFLKIKQPILESGRALAPAQLLTTASTGTALSGYGVTIITSTAATAKTYKLPTPARTGAVKEIIFRSKATGSKIIVAAGPSTAQTFFNSTKGTLVSSTAQHAQPPASVRLIAVASTGTYSLSWSVLAKTTAITFSA